MKVCSQVCGVIFDPLDEDFLNVCDECEHKMPEGDEEATGSFYLGSCGLIFDYLL